MEKETKTINHKSGVDFGLTQIDNAINELQRLKDLGCTVIMMKYQDFNDRYLLDGIQYRPESDDEYNERVQAYEEQKKREHQNNLVEFARLKAKLYPEQ